ncbi:hypothetical protein OAE03_03375 [Winogradskyella sp.]|nr:hypothetical protein [Winogradskyella sp.]
MKYINKYHALVLCFLVGTICASSQNNIQWNADSFAVGINDVDVAITSNLSKQNGIFTWEQISNLSSQSTQYEITSTTGNWDAQLNIGSISYMLTTEDNTNATLTIRGITEELTMHLIIYDASGQLLKDYIFIIENFTNL